MKDIDRVTPPPAVAADEMCQHRPVHMLKRARTQSSDDSGTFFQILSALTTVDG